MYEISDFPAFVGPPRAIVPLIHCYFYKLWADLLRQCVRCKASFLSEDLVLLGCESASQDSVAF
jgi:hypothetical protein